MSMTMQHPDTAKSYLMVHLWLCDLSYGSTEPSSVAHKALPSPKPRLVFFALNSSFLELNHLLLSLNGKTLESCLQMQGKHLHMIL